VLRVHSAGADEAGAGLPLTRISDESAHDYEKEHLPDPRGRRRVGTPSGLRVKTLSTFRPIALRSISAGSSIASTGKNAREDAGEQARRRGVAVAARGKGRRRPRSHSSGTCPTASNARPPQKCSLRCRSWWKHLGLLRARSCALGPTCRSSVKDAFGWSSPPPSTESRAGGCSKSGRAVRWQRGPFLSWRGMVDPSVLDASEPPRHPPHDLPRRNPQHRRPSASHPSVKSGSFWGTSARGHRHLAVFAPGIGVRTGCALSMARGAGARGGSGAARRPHLPGLEAGATFELLTLGSTLRRALAGRRRRCAAPALDHLQGTGPA